jgi:hypothetical protein
MWRDKYGFGYNGRVNSNDPDVDASAQLPDGPTFTGIRGLQEVLLKDEDRFLNCLIEKVMIYSLGRGLDYTDRPLREQLRTNLKANGYTLRGLIQDIVVSEAFLRK